MSAINITAPLETASEKERFQFYRRLTARIMKTEETAVETTGNTATPLWTKSMPADSVMTVAANVTAIRSDGVEAAGYFRWAGWRRVGSAAATEIAAATLLSYESDSSWVMTIVAGSTTGDVELRVTGDAGVTIAWEASVTFKLQAL